MNPSASASMAAVVLAGGLGTRVRALYPDLPKPMIPVSGRPFMDWILMHLWEQGIREVVISAGYLGDVIAGYYRTHPMTGLSVSVVQEPEPLGTAGAFLYAQNHTSAAKLLVLNGDSLVCAPLEEFARSSDPAVILGVEVQDSSRYGTLDVDGEGRLLRFGEKQHGAGMINAGVYLFQRETLRLFPRKLPLSFETDVFPALIACEAGVRVRVVRAPFLDMGTPESLLTAASFIDSHFSWHATL